MNLVLEIVTPNGASLGAARRKVFGPEGGRIGRSADCDWVLANPYVSRHHATIRWISGTFYIESTGENGVAIGTPQAIIPKLERRPLKNGDHVFIDEYEVVVGLGNVVAGAAPSAGSGLDAFAPAAGGAAPLVPPGSGAAFAPTDDPFDLGPTRASRALVDPLEPAHEELDPLKHLGARGAAASPAVTAPRQESSWNHTPGVSDHFAAPPVPAAGAVIPDDWDKTTFGRAKSAPPAAPRGAPAAGSASGAAAIPDDWDKTNFSSKPAAAPASRPAPAPAGAAGSVAAPAQAAAPPRAAARAPDIRPSASGAVPAAPRPAPAGATAAGAAPRPAGQATRSAGRPAAQPASVPQGAASAAARPRVPQAAAFDVAEFLTSAGVDPASIPPETAGALGQILRSVVQGVIDVLRARAEIKEQFRLSQTIVKTAENNPLKFAVNAEDALGSLLGRRNPAYLPPVEAFEDAFDDIRFHQLAMLAGMRAGFDQVLNRFDPQQLQEGFEKRARRGGLLSMNARSRYWEQFTEDFQELAGDRERAFRRLFAEEFAAAYEKQLEILKRNQGKGRR